MKTNLTDVAFGEKPQNKKNSDKNRYFNKIGKIGPHDYLKESYHTFTGLLQKNQVFVSTQGNTGNYVVNFKFHNVFEIPGMIDDV